MALSLCAIGMAQLGGLPLPAWFRTSAAVVVLSLAVVLLLWRDSRAILRIVRQAPSPDGGEVEIRTSRTLHPAAIRLTWSGMPSVPWGVAPEITLSGEKLVHWDGSFGDRVPALGFTWSDPPFRRRDRLTVKLEVGAPIRFAKVEVIDPSEVNDSPGSDALRPGGAP